MSGLFIPSITEDAYWQQLKEILTDVVRNEVAAFRQQNLSQKKYTIKEIMELFHVSRATVLNWRARGLLNGERIGRQVYFSHEEIEKALKSIKKYHLKIA